MTTVMLNGGDFDGRKIDLEDLADAIVVDGQPYRRMQYQDGRPMSDTFGMPLYLWDRPPDPEPTHAVRPHTTGGHHQQQGRGGGSGSQRGSGTATGPRPPIQA